ncbi:hypothetical protein Btru_039507 [Bulinus truncatus]|nr:hypothetical protein Btru_039507 [Bulinus truncatus]
MSNITSDVLTINIVCYSNALSLRLSLHRNIKMLLILFLAMPLAVIHGFDFATFAPFMPWIDGTNPNVQFAVKAINEYYVKQGDTTERKFLAVLQSESQTSSGTHYQFTLRVSDGSQNEICEVDVLSRPWLSGDEATQTTKDPVCTPEVQGKRLLPGGESAIDINDPDVQKALDFAVSRLNAMENYMFLRKVVQVSHVTSQVVAGISYHFTGVQMAATTCDKMSTHQLSSCQVADGADVKTCEFKVWWQSWSTPEYQLSDFHCN